MSEERRTKADYVRAQPHTLGHKCHWPGCERDVPPAMWGCKTHWFHLPARLRAAIWRTYRPGQEISKDPSPEYLAVAREVQKVKAAAREALEALDKIQGSDPFFMPKSIYEPNPLAKELAYRMRFARQAAERLRKELER